MSKDIEKIKASLLDDEARPPQEPAVIYDRNATQRVPLVAPQGDKTFNVEVEIAPISDEDYFKLLEEIPENAKKIKGVSVDLFMPFANLGRRLAVARYGFKERSDWRERMNDTYFISAVQGVLECSATSDEEVIKDELLDDDAVIRIPLRAPFNGRECETEIFFREESKEEMDEFFAALRGDPKKGVLASAKKISKERRLFDLYQETRVEVKNYKDDLVPAWHAIEAVQVFFLRQFARVKNPSIR